ncbi:hypothetical protein WN982_25370 [Paraburkholderia sp. IMGN_8]|uniref:hypothetical protein n=1 Tax=Paraburkholderia sp. IMGN_8 TaxID=3136564 RepID=UPI003100B472
MVDLPRCFDPIQLSRPRGAHRYDAFSPKLNRRLTFYGRSAFEAWLMIESDPGVRTFCERPGVMTVDGHRCIVDFWLSFVDHEGLVLLSDRTPATDRLQNYPDFDSDSFIVRHIGVAERAAARVWIGNWQRMLPVLVSARGLVTPSLLNAIERFVATPQPLLSVEREFSTGDPVLVRAAAFELLHLGRVQAIELHTESLSLLTRFATAQAAS